MTFKAKNPIYLIINADDYGYFPCVSKGILDAAKTGALTATGILANSPDLEQQLEWAGSCKNLDLGVHLNLTSRHPLTSAMANKLAQSGGLFQGAFATTGLVLSGKIDVDTIRSEWRTQIDTCLSKGAELTFLNSHEHIHMLPVLFKLSLELAEEYKIPYVRLTMPEWVPPFGISPLIRNVLMQSMSLINQRRVSPDLPKCIGLGKSGKLDLEYLSRIFAKLKPGSAYELMCHPGHFNPGEISDSRLLSYHAWEQEYDLLNSSDLQSLYTKFGIEVISYRDLLKKSTSTL